MPSRVTNSEDSARAARRRLRKPAGDDQEPHGDDSDEIVRCLSRAVDVLTQAISLLTAGVANQGASDGRRQSAPVGRHLGGEIDSLRPAARRILAYLLDHPGQYVSRRELLRHARAKTVNERTIAVHISRIRTMLGQHLIEDAILTGERSYAANPQRVEAIRAVFDAGD